MLAEKKVEGVLFIEPKRIITMAEVLDPLDQTFIEKVFQQKIHQVYQCTEGFLAATCSHGTLHLNEDIVLIEKEFLDDECEKFSPIITDFTRKTQPIIRYQLNDILTLKRNGCPCGSPMTAIEQIEGRCDDIFYFKKKDKTLTRIFPDFVRRSVMTASTSIKEYRVIQHHLEKIEIQILADEQQTKIEEMVKKSLEGFLISKEIELPRIVFSPYERKEKLQKLKRIERKFII